MILLEYNPEVINSYVSFDYCQRHELPTQGIISMIAPIDKSKLILLTYDDWSCAWILYHTDKNINKDIIVDRALSPDVSYLCVMTDNDNIENIQQINHNNGEKVDIFSGMSRYDLNSNTYRKKVYYSDHSMAYTYEKPSPILFNDIIILNPEKPGIYYLNSSSYIDFMFYILKTGLFIDRHYTLINKDLTKGARKDFKNHISILNSNRPKDEYCTLYQYMNKEKGYDAKMKIFQDNVMKILSNKTTIYDFIIKFKKDLCLELNNIYHRMRCFPNERKIIYEKYHNHPYIKLIKLLHKNFLTQHKPITEDIVSELLFESSEPYVIYDNIIYTLIDGLKRRSELFNTFYHLHINSKKGKYRSRYRHYSFRIFSETLFVMEHLLMSK